MTQNSSSLLEKALAKKLVFVTGKGGIGKTLVAAALGQAKAEYFASKKQTSEVLITETALTDQIAPLFGHAPVGHKETLVRPNLYTINLDPPLNFRDYVVKYLNQPKLYERIFSNRLVQSFINTIPGFAELMMLGRTFYTAELAPEPRPEFIVFDAYASGHFLSLMTTPDAVLSAGFGGPLARETERVKAFLSDPEKTGIIYVTTPEELVISETLDFLPKLQAKAPAPILGVIVNRLPRPFDHTTEKLDPVLTDFMVARSARAESALLMLKRGLHELSRSGLFIDAWTLADLGAVFEPLPDQFGKRWLEAGAPL